MNILRLRHLPLDHLKLFTAPAAEPLSLDDVKAHLRITHADEDATFQFLIAAIRQQAEEHLGRALITQTWQLFLDYAPSPGLDEWWDGVRDGAIAQDMPAALELPRPPLQSVTHIKVYDNNDGVLTFASTNYFVDTAGDPGRIALRRGSVWPVPDRDHNGLEIQFVAGYGVTGATVPAAIRLGMLQWIAAAYRNRSLVNEVPYEVDQMWLNYRVRR